MHRWTGFVSVLLFVVPASAKTLEEVEKAVTAAMEKHKSVRCKLDMRQQVDTGMLKSKTSANGTFECRKNKDGKYSSRTEMKGRMKMEVMGNAQEQPMEMLMIDDGQYQYTLMTTGRKRHAIKGQREASNAIGGKQFFELQRQMATLKLLPDEKLGDVDCYVIESTPKTPIPMFAKSVNYIDKRRGIALKMVAFDEKGKEMMTMKSSDIRLNVDIPDSRFVFKVPKGVIMRDMTKAASRPSSRPTGSGASGGSAGQETPDIEAILKRLQEQQKRSQQGDKR
jgi:outer membrane lipoprotein-sorting protein